MSALVDRITAVLAAHPPVPCGPEIVNRCGNRDCRSLEWSPAHVAEAVAEALQLTEEMAPSMPHWKRFVTPYEQDICTCTADGLDPQCPDHASIAPEWTI